VLGPLEVRVGEHPASPGGPKQRSVLSLLALRSGTTVAVDELVAAVWGEDADVPDVLDALRVYLSNLRALLDPGRSRGDVGSRVLRDGTGYRLQVRPEELDVLRFTDSVAAARRSAAAGDLVAAVHGFRAAEALWRGAPCPDLADGLRTQPDLASLRDLQLSATEDRIDVEMALGRHATVVSELLPLVQSHPLRERLRSQLMLALYRCGRQEEALAVYGDLRGTLADTLGVDPTPTVQSLQRAILRQEPALDPPQPRGAARPRVRYRVPSAPNQLIGRQRDLDRLVARLRKGRGRVVTLVGPGGVGKTRLALAAAATLAPEYPDGACWVPLGGLADPALVPQAIATALALPGSPDQDPATAVAEHLAAHDVLLVLDNFEHLLPAADMVADLVAEVPALSVLVTSRCGLGLSAELEQPVEPLPVPLPADSAAQDVRLAPAARLFLARARAVEPEFRMDDATAPAVAEICRRLDGVPLAIELAAARIRVLSPAAIAGRLDRALALLTKGPRDVPDRQRTLRATLEWSYQLLPPAERRLLSRLGIFSGGAQLADIEAVCGFTPLDGDVLDGLDTLVRHSLAQLRQDAGDESRTVLLETVREFGLEQLRLEGEYDEVARRHAEHYAARVEDHDLGHGPGQEEATAWLRAERDNLRLALNWCSEAPSRTDTGLRLVAGLGRFWEITSALEEGLSWCRRLLPEDVDGSGPAAGPALNTAGTLAWLQGDYEQARAWHRRALAVQEAAGDRAGAAWSLVCLSTQDLSQGRLAEGEQLLHRALALARRTDADRVHRTAIQCLGVSRLWQGDPEGALRLTEQSLAMARRAGDQRDAAILLNNLGDMTLRLGDPAAALALMQEGLTITQGLGDLTTLASCLSSVAEVAVSLGAPDRALRLLGAVHTIQEVTGLRRPDLEEQTVGPIRAAASASLGTASAAAVWAEGLTIGVERAVQEALSLHAALTVATRRTVRSA
jgi:predicted ATPase/DNA-binding SARP family transcriptional activator